MTEQTAGIIIAISTLIIAGILVYALWLKVFPPEQSTKDKLTENLLLQPTFIHEGVPDLKMTYRDWRLNQGIESMFVITPLIDKITVTCPEGYTAPNGAKTVTFKKKEPKPTKDAKRTKR